MPTDARTQPSVCKEQLIPMDNIVQLIPFAQLIAKRPLFAEPKEQTRMENFALVSVHQLVELTKF